MIFTLFLQIVHKIRTMPAKKNNLEDISQKAIELFNRQLKSWNLAANNYATLKNVAEKTFSFDHSVIKVQYNPARAVSSGAKVDSKTIAERPCFLCMKNLPKEQEVYPLSNDFVLAVNPFPVFFPHFTIPHRQHIPQQILPYIGEMLQMSEILSDFTLFYNGPACGASAPDHLHFQAAPKGSMPVEWEIMQETKDKRNSGEKYREQYDELRMYYFIEWNDKNEVQNIFEKIYNKLPHPVSNEPMMNILTCYTKGIYRVIIFPRKNHRPLQYFAEDAEKIMISPGAVDMAGILITPRKEDFDKLTKSNIKNIFEQVSLQET